MAPRTRAQARGRSLSGVPGPSGVQSLVRDHGRARRRSRSGLARSILVRDTRRSAEDKSKCINKAFNEEIKNRFGRGKGHRMD